MKHLKASPLLASLLTVGISVVATGYAYAQSGSTTVNTLASVLSSSTDLDGSGDDSSLPAVFIALTPGTNRVLTFSSITGSIDPGAGFAGGADGDNYTGTGVDISDLGSISGVIDSSDHAVAFMGAFTSASPATGATPARLDFTGNHAFTSLSPLLNQSFFIGDGLTGTGAGTTQQFFVPDGANFLQLGFADAFAFSGTPFVGVASSYSDNSGSFAVDYNISVVPEPGTFALALPAFGILVAGVAVRKRRK